METSSDLHTTDAPAFHAEDLDEVANYRSMSGLAIVSLVFGLASPVCFASPVFLAIPLFGAALSIVALQRIAASDGVLAGKWAAAAGLALCVGSVAAALSHAQVTRYMHARQAKQLGHQWIKLLVAGQAQEAFNLTVESTRPEPPEPPAGPPGGAPQEPPFDRFMKHPLIQALTSVGPDAEVRFVETLVYEPRAYRQCVVQQRFEAIPASNSAAERQTEVQPIEALLTMQLSQLPGESQSRWLVVGYVEQGQPYDFGARP